MTAAGRRTAGSGRAPGRVRVLLFATARTAAGRGSVDWPVPTGGTTLRALLDELAEAHPGLGPILIHARIFHAGSLADRLDARVRAGDEVAVHPPYGGG
jgi:molybdopterin converting factor small subunit